MQKSNIITAVIVGIAFVVGLGALANGVGKVRRSPEPLINVTGMAERNFTSDLAVWSARYEVMRFDMQQAFADLAGKRAQVKKFLQSKGIAEDKVEYSSVSIDRRYDKEGYCDQKVFVGFALSQSITITSNNIEEVENLSRSITELINEGVEIYSESPQFYYTKLNQLKIEMLKAASEDAYNRAAVVAEGGKGSLGKLVKSDVGVFQIVGLNSNEDYSWGGSFNTSRKEKTASVTVRSSYRVK